MSESLWIGLMSGTSVDGIDCALVDLAVDTINLLNTLQVPIPADIQQAIRALSQPGEEEIDRLGRLDRQLGGLFADAVSALLAQTSLEARDIRAIGSHGQTVRHRPVSAGEPAGQAFTLQIGDPNTIAERTGITTVADFRRRDIAAGGEGAPLAPAFHAAAFARPGSNRAIVNIGGIANVSLLAGSELRGGFDTGPGNTLLDHWTRLHRGAAYDRDGAWAAEGTVDDGLLASLTTHPYLLQRGPRSTGKESFNPEWLTRQLSLHPGVAAGDVQATLAEFTARTIARGIREGEIEVEAVYVCGGGAHNQDLMRRLHRLLVPALLADTAALGIEPDWVEAAAFAWLARQALDGRSGNAPVVTGAAGPRVLGGIYPA
jgi:anhydro-N-acetylmuramic acid kinase